MEFQDWVSSAPVRQEVQGSGLQNQAVQKQFYAISHQPYEHGERNPGNCWFYLVFWGWGFYWQLLTFYLAFIKSYLALSVFIYPSPLLLIF